MAQLVVSFIGEDRPGIIDEMSQCIKAADASWAASRLCRLAGKFSGILLIEVKPGQVQALTETLKAMSKGALTLLVENGNDEETLVADTSIQVVGNDRPGIVKDIAGIFAAEGINVIELKTDVNSAPMSGTHLFEAIFKIAEKDANKREAVCSRIEALASDLMVEIKLIAH